MDWQLIVVFLIAAFALAYLCRQTWLSWVKGKTGCGGGCCSKTAQAAARQDNAKLVSVDELTSRLEKRRADPQP